jgi:hypothetical protein
MMPRFAVLASPRREAMGRGTTRLNACVSKREGDVVEGILAYFQMMAFQIKQESPPPHLVA